MATKVLMVCLGNICRSPLAEGILRSKVNADEVIVASAGTSNYHVGNAPDSRSIEIAKQNNIDISYLKGKQFSATDFDDFDHIYVMDNTNYNEVINLARSYEDREKVKLILNEVFPNENVDVPDPYYGGAQGFINVFDMLNEACEAIAKKL